MVALFIRISNCKCSSAIHSNVHLGCSNLQLALLLLGQELPENVAAASEVVELLLGKVALLGALGDQTLQALELLLGVLLVCGNLLKDLDIVLGVLVLDVGRGLLDLLDTVSVGLGELGDDGVESLIGATGGIETTANGAVGSSVGVDELDKVLLGASALVWEGLGGALLEVLDGGVRADALLGSNGLGVLGFGVDLGDQDAGLEGKISRNLLPGGGEALAVCTFGQI